MCVGTSFKTREELGDAFTKLGTTVERMIIKLHKLRYYSKLTSACQTDFMGSAQQQLIAVGRYSGVRKSIYTDIYTHAFRNFLRSEGEVSSTIGNTIASATAHLMRIKQSLQEKIDENPRDTIGTVKWRRLAGLNRGAEQRIEMEDVPTATGRFFLSSNKPS